MIRGRPATTRRSGNRRSRYQFTLGALLLAVTAFAILCSAVKSLGPVVLLLTLMALPAVLVVLLLRVTAGQASPGVIIVGVPFAALAFVGVSLLSLAGEFDTPKLQLLAVMIVVFCFGLGGLAGGSIHAIRLGYAWVGWTAMTLSLLATTLCLLYLLLPVHQ